VQKSQPSLHRKPRNSLIFSKFYKKSISSTPRNGILLRHKDNMLFFQYHRGSVLRISLDLSGKCPLSTTSRLLTAADLRRDPTPCERQRLHHPQRGTGGCLQAARHSSFPTSGECLLHLLTRVVCSASEELFPRLTSARFGQNKTPC